MRNREIWLYCIVAVSISILCTVVGFQLGIYTGVMCLILSVLLSGWGFAFTMWRYRQIKKLSTALAAAAAGVQVLDLRTNREGELSVLQNDLYKLAAALTDKVEHLHKDKAFLANTLSDISHQLKTPLTSLLVLSDLLQDETLPPQKKQEFLSRISAQLQRLRWLVSSLLRLSRLDADVVVFRREDIALHRMLTKAAEPLLALAEQKDVSLTVDCARTLRWWGDADWTQEAIGNLMKNCVEHSPSGGAVFLCCVDTPLHTLLTIEDNGPGFASKDLPHLFERFYRGEGSDGDGAGIGLAMAKSILHAQQADVSAQNRPDGGARFVVKFYN